MIDPHKETDELLIWANEVAKKYNVTMLHVVGNYFKFKKDNNLTHEKAKIVIENNLKNGVDTNEK